MLPPPEYEQQQGGEGQQRPTTVLILPSFTVVERVAPRDAPELLRRFVDPGPTTQTPLPLGGVGVGVGSSLQKQVEVEEEEEANTDVHRVAETETLTHHLDDCPPEVASPDAHTPPSAAAAAAVNDALHEAVAALALHQHSQIPPAPAPPLPASATPGSSTLASHPCPHDYIVLLCSHKRRDARCGISAPLLAKEFARHLRPLGLHRDLDDTRPGGVGLYFINHVGGHKYAANVLIYRKADGMGAWLARVAPKHVEVRILSYIILYYSILYSTSSLPPSSLSLSLPPSLSPFTYTHN